MARDYSNRGNNSRNKKSGSSSQKRSRASSRRKSPRKNTRKTDATPGWVWVGIGLCLGLVVAAIIYLATRPTSHPGRGSGTMEIVLPQQGSAEDAGNQSDGKQVASKKGEAAQSPAQAEKQVAEQRFVFYERFHDAKIVFPKERYPQGTGSTHEGAIPSHDVAGSQEEHTAEQPSTPSFKPGTYVIQAGSFVTTENAHQLKAKLTLLGLNARIIRHKFKTGRVVYRVRSQTITSNNRLTRLLKRLRDNGIATLVLRKES